MAQNDVLAERGEHVGRAFACVGAAFGKVHILGTNANARGLQGIKHAGEAMEGWANNFVYAFDLA